MLVMRCQICYNINISADRQTDASLLSFHIIFYTIRRISVKALFSLCFILFRKENSMITLLYGAYGSGKSHSVLESIKKDTAQGIHTFLIIPDQEAVQSERSTLIALPNSAQLNLEVLSFSRLYNRVCREYGGLSYRYITKPVRHLLMWQNIRELIPELQSFTNISQKDTSMCDILLSAISECKASAITPEMLEKTARTLPDDSPLKKRLMDLVLIYSSYDRLVSSSYSDSSDDLSRLYDVLKKESFFKGCNVYIDSFTSFTGAEHRVIERIFADAANVTVSIPLPHPECNDISVRSIKRSQSRLIESASKRGGHKEVILKGNRRALSPVLAHVAKNLWRPELSSDEYKVYNDGSIVAEICDTPYAEAEATANRILELLRSGERCRDMLVLMRSPDNYRGIIEPAFEKNGIPYYFSEKTDLNALPPVKLLFSALRIKQYNWQKNDIISHIKTGIYDIPSRDCDLFEEYINTWNLHGSRFSEGEAWTMNPDGYADKLTPRGKEILVAANSVRVALIAKLERFFILLDGSETVPDMCKAVYSYLTDICLEDRLSELAMSEAKRGNIKGAGELRSIYKIILDSLADIATALPYEEANTEEFSLILKTIFDRTDIGTIPTSVDEVIIGSAATLRASNPKYTFVLGLCEGEFPAAVNDTGLFSSAERSTLEELGLEFSTDTDTRASDELMYAQRAFASPSCGLYLITSSAEYSGRSRSPSMPFTRALALLRDYEPHKFSGNDLSYLVGAPRSAISHMRTLGGTSEGMSLKKALSEHIPSIERISDLPVSAENYSLSEDTVNATLGKETAFSSSRFEKYVQCPMSYYCSYVLKLREKVSSDFLSSDMGTFVHAILEKLISFATTPKENGELPTDSEIVERTEAEVIEYIDRISPLELKRSKKLSHVYKRLKDLALLMVRNIATEFAASDFTPEFFELSIDGEGTNPKPMEFIHDDGSKFSFVGKIDRVDVLRKDGKVYVRVIDYKTGTKSFSLDDVEHGINTQMLLYLFMLCKTPGSSFCNELGLDKDDTPIPAGIMYLSANIPTIQSLTHEGEDSVRGKAEGELRRSGLLLSDPEILSAMNRELSRKFLAGIYQKKDC